MQLKFKNHLILEKFSYLNLFLVCYKVITFHVIIAKTVECQEILSWSHFVKKTMRTEEIPLLEDYKKINANYLYTGQCQAWV